MTLQEAFAWEFRNLGFFLMLLVLASLLVVVVMASVRFARIRKRTGANTRLSPWSVVGGATWCAVGLIGASVALTAILHFTTGGATWSELLAMLPSVVLAAAPWALWPASLYAVLHYIVDFAGALARDTAVRGARLAAAPPLGNAADQSEPISELAPAPLRFEEDVATAVRLSETRLQRPVAVKVRRDGETTEPVTKPGPTRGEAPVIWYGSYLDTAPPQVRGWTAAHEVGHVVLGHPDSGRWHPPAFRTAVGLLALVWIVAMVVVVMETAGPDLSWVAGGLALTTLGLLVPGLAAIVGVDNFFSRRAERAADAWATDLVGPLSDADRDWLKRHVGRPLDPRPPGEGPPSERAPIVTRTHPRWDTRGHARRRA